MGKRRAWLALLSATLMLSISLSGCLTLVVGREIMEGARGTPTIEDTSMAYDLSHEFTSTEFSAIAHGNQTVIPIDETVSEVIVHFGVQLSYDDVGGVGLENFTAGQRYVEAWLYPPGESPNGNPWWHERTEEDFAQNRSRWADQQFESGDWLLEVDAMGYGVDAPIDSLSFHDTFELRVTVIRPCVIFPETPDVCTPQVELED